MLASAADSAARHVRPQQNTPPPVSSAPAAQAPEASGSARERAARILEQLRSQIEAAKETVEANPAPKTDDTLLNRTDMARLMEDLLEESGVPKQKRISVTPWSGLLNASNARLSSGFGMRKDPFTGRPQHHNGIDVAAPMGTKIYPYASGTVIRAGWNGGYGRMVTIRHDDGTETRYGHTSKNLVEVGDKVTLGEPIAEVGSTGRSTGPHLHFEMRRNGKPVDPVPYLSGPRLSVAQR
jgi:murein DD-endopeptidase MepM/ murein hydrolase activator NlpD